ncbi:histidine kinase [Desulfobacter hydrogenophilus]|uniref:histidine kinase n=1 Tax=Desulfobacter hydrogenophilus TaxID=2291 RepID=A0A328FB41_9BACT|nr:CHASE2 domain-containing protein [Desulfobacter hydrogenophilus]NDY73605.1 CHASE2 domain-containing protein [Desulfobacter hydrogenophilus]QBH12098.1 CHASE2 domain-containing protein [Desulfobacter hydrogenophilus]RAM00652.1 histidine kinase [Desulfobacter hydrogenophilus]
MVRPDSLAPGIVLTGKKHHLRYLLMGLVCLLVVGLVDTMGFFRGMDFYAYDLFFRLRGTQTTTEDILIVAIDEKTLGKLGPWPIPRRHYAHFLDQTDRASGILGDIILAEPAAGDSLLEKAMARFPRLVLPAYVDSGCHLILPAPSMGNPALGHVHTEPGMDGVVRDIFHTLFLDGKRLPSISSALIDIISGNPRVRADQFRTNGGDCLGSIIQEDGRGINYYGSAGIFPRLSFSDILENKYPPAFFEGKILVLGVTAAGIDQNHLTSFTQNRDRMPGVEIQATVLNNLLDGSHIRTICMGGKWTGIVLVFILSALGFSRLGSVRALAGWTVFLIVFTIMDFLLLNWFHFWMPPVAFWVVLTIALVSAHVLKLETMGQKLFQAQKDWETSFDSITDAIIILDRAGHPVLINRSAENGAAKAIERYMKDKDRSFLGDIPVQIYAKDLNRHFEVQAFPRLDENNLSAGSVLVVRDITESTHLKQEQVMLQSQLIQSQKMEAIGTLAGGIAHDFNNILSAIMGYTQLAAALIPEEKKVQKKLQEVLKACSRAANLVTQILGFSRRTDQKRLSFMVRPIVKEILQLLKATLPPTIEMKADVTGAERVTGDPGQIYQVILNLCTNAYQAMGEGPGQIKIIVESIDVDSKKLGPHLELAPGKYVKISVADTGSGIPEDIKSRVFEPYFTTKAKHTGTGLGLATTHGIVKRHGGSIRFESRKNEGTCFHVYLPQAKKKEAGQPHMPDAKGKKAHGRLLLVDDRQELLDTGRKLLENQGYEVEVKKCPEQALDRFRSTPDMFDAVITDLHMKKMTGITLAKKLLSVRQDIPIILCTGYHDGFTREHAMAAGVSAVVKKPFSIQELSGTIQTAMEKK